MNAGKTYAREMNAGKPYAREMNAGKTVCKRDECRKNRMQER